MNYYYDGNNPLSSSYPHYALALRGVVLAGYNPLTSPTCDTVFTEMYITACLAHLLANSSPSTAAGCPLAATYTYDTEGRMSAENLPTDNSGNHVQPELY